ncbi:MAG: Peptide deformylase [Candidatus Hodgkinia cicadicola]|nr:MAG: Peptide deformylase [Candidatus Hodgkinia cicadicola]
MSPNILRYPAPAIRFNNTKLLYPNIFCVHRLIHLMITNSALGISSSQVGWPYGTFVINLPTVSWKRKLHVLAYPTLVYDSEYRTIFNEACLSTSGEYSINRRKKLIVTCYDVLRDTVCVIKSYSLFTACLQHEWDHNRGYLILDRHGNS